MILMPTAPKATAAAVAVAAAAAYVGESEEMTKIR